MTRFHCRIPNIHFGFGVREQLGSLPGIWGKRAFLALDPFLNSSGVGGEIEGLLKRYGIETVKWTDITPNPDCFSADRAAEVARRESCTLVVGLGGGSDPELMMSMPPRLTAYTGIDALTHSIDSYVSALAQPFSRLLSLESIRLVARWLPEAVASGANRQARERMAWASTLGGMAIAHAGTTLPHALGQPVSGICGAPHGGSIAACLVEVMRYSFVADFRRYAEIAEALDPSARDLPLRRKAEASAEAVERLFRDTGTTVRFSDFGMREEDIDKATHIALTGYGGDIAIHPRVASEDEIKGLYRACL